MVNKYFAVIQCAHAGQIKNLAETNFVQIFGKAKQILSVQCVRTLGKMRLTAQHDSYDWGHLYVCRSLLIFGLSTPRPFVILDVLLKVHARGGTFSRVESFDYAIATFFQVKGMVSGLSAVICMSLPRI